MSVIPIFVMTFLGAMFLIVQKNHLKNPSNFNKDSITLTIDQGTLVGTKSLDYGNETFYSFIGIPYAKPPIGELRFKPPEPAGEWSGIYNATILRPVCPQILIPDILIQGMEQSENCLFLNVHTRMSKKLKPVMVYFVGGSFGGSIFEPRYGPKLLMTEDIVLVFVSYRLNIFGYSAVNNTKYGIDGNMGFKDQILGLKWVQKNIYQFGGNPNQVTIFGQSGAGNTVDLLYLSPLAKGLFQRAIAQSGSAESIALRTPNEFIDLAAYLNCSSDNLSEVINCLNQTKTENFIIALNALQRTGRYNKILKLNETYLYNTLTIERNFNCDSFLNEEPGSIAKRGEFNPVPMILGFNTDDSKIFAGSSYIKPNFTDNRVLIPQDIKIDLSSDKAVDFGKRIKQLYYGNLKPSDLLLDPFLAYLTDIFFVQKIYKFSKLQANVAKTYFYQFNYYTKLNLPQNTTKKYILHGSELIYLFSQEGRTPEYLDPNSEEFVAVHRMIKLWTTFAKTGNPNPKNDPLLDVKWLPIEPNKFNYLKIQPNLELDVNPLEERMKFWEEIYAEFNNDIY